MRQGEIQQLLVAGNRWWRSPTGWARHDPDLREAAQASFRYTAGVLAGLPSGSLTTLRGPRRVGKSVEIKRAIESLIAGGTAPRLIVHVAADGWRAADLARLVNAADQLTPAGHRYWFIDEITSIRDGWPERVKWLRDNDAAFRTDTVVLSGSSAADLTAATKALAGRRGPGSVPDRFLLPMGFRTFAALANDADEHGPPIDVGPLAVAELSRKRIAEACEALAPWLDWLVQRWDAYLRVGGFPSALDEFLASRDAPNPLRRALLDVVHGDALRRADWSRTQTAALLQRIADGLCSPVNYAALADDVDLAQPTVRRRFEELREAFVVWPCHREQRPRRSGESPRRSGEGPRHGESLRPKLNARCKFYFLDPIYAHLGGSPPDDTQLSEQQLGMALLRAAERERPGALVDFSAVLHHRSNTRREIDFVGPAFGGLAIESKFVDGRWKRDAQTLAASPWRGIVATRSELDLREDNKAVAVPTALLAWLVDS